MSDQLAARRAELRTLEDKWYSSHEGPRVIGASAWDAHAPERREIDQRYGIKEDDPRAYSISAYLAERKELEEEWGRLSEEKGWAGASAGTPLFQESWSAYMRFCQRIADCTARHFPGLQNGIIDTRPKLWAHIIHHALIAAEVIARVDPAQTGHRPATCPREAQAVYTLLHKLKVPWAPQPPYKGLTQQEAIDELMRIANQLEREDAGQCAEQLRRCPDQAADNAAADKAKRDKPTDARDKWVYEQCCEGVPYDFISRQLSKKNPKWRRISTKQGILDCARRYAERKGLPKPPPRQGQEVKSSQLAC